MMAVEILRLGKRALIGCTPGSLFGHTKKRCFEYFFRRNGAVTNWFVDRHGECLGQNEKWSVKEVRNKTVCLPTGSATNTFR